MPLASTGSSFESITFPSLRHSSMYLTSTVLFGIVLLVCFLMDGLTYFFSMPSFLIFLRFFLAMFTYVESTSEMRWFLLSILAEIAVVPAPPNGS